MDFCKLIRLKCVYALKSDAQTMLKVHFIDLPAILILEKKKCPFLKE